MGIGMPYLEYLAKCGHLKRSSRVLDIGSQNLYNVTIDSFREFVQKFGNDSSDAALSEAAKTVSYFSTPRPGERTAYLSELFDHTEIFYTSYDVCPALKTEIFDLNHERLPRHYVGYFDIVLNFGTTEHIFNQLNSFEVMHSALAVGGVAFHQVPSIAWTDHGYFAYHMTFFDDLAKANGYDLLDCWYTAAGISNPRTGSLETRDQSDPLLLDSTTVAPLPDQLLNYNLNVVLRKSQDAPFRVALEIATSHSELSDQIKAAYGVDRTLNEPRRLTDEMLLNTIKKCTAQVVGNAIMESLPQALSRGIQDVLPNATQNILPKIAHDAIDGVLSQAAVEKVLSGAIDGVLSQAAVEKVLSEAVDGVLSQAVAIALQGTLTAEMRSRAINETRTAELAAIIMDRLRRKIGL